MNITRGKVFEHIDEPNRIIKILSKPQRMVTELGEVRSNMVKVEYIASVLKVNKGIMAYITKEYILTNYRDRDPDITWEV